LIKGRLSDRQPVVASYVSKSHITGTYHFKITIIASTDHGTEPICGPFAEWTFFLKVFLYEEILSYNKDLLSSTAGKVGEV
jgi:hypothetical protein